MVDSVLLYFDFVYMHEFVYSHVFIEKPQDLYATHSINNPQTLRSKFPQQSGSYNTLGAHLLAPYTPEYSKVIKMECVAQF